MTGPLPYLVPRGYPSLLSIVIPLYNEGEAVLHLRNALTEFLPQLPCRAELVLVNDGSKDGTLFHLVEWASSDPRVRVLNFARNFGHQAACTAGLDHATGDAVVVMDADLQDPPEVILEMLREYTKGYDVVYGKRSVRIGETAFKRFSAWAFYRVMRLMIYRDLPADVGDFRLVSRRFLGALGQMRETHRFLRGMVAWAGFPQTSVTYTRQPRCGGTTKYPLAKMLMLAWTAAVSFSPTPLRLSFGLGLIVGLLGVTQGINAVIRKVLGLYTVPGWSSIIVAICLIGGAILMSIGVLGEYIGRIYEEAKGRPLYIVADEIGAATADTPATVASSRAASAR